MTRRHWLQLAAASPLVATVGDTPDLNELLGSIPRDLGPAIEFWGTNRDALRRRYPVRTSVRRLQRLRNYHRGWRAAIDRIPFDGLPLAAKVDWVTFRTLLDFEIHLSVTEERKLEAARELIPHLDELSRLEEALKNLEWAEPQQAAALLDRADKELTAFRKSPPRAEKIEANRAVRYLAPLRDSLKRWYRFHEGYDPLFAWWMKEPYARLDQSLGAHAAFLRETIVGVKPDDRDTIIGDPVGRDVLMRGLEAEMIPYTPEELIDLAQREFAWCDTEMLKASRELGFGDDWKKALEHVKTLNVAPGKQPELIRSLEAEAVAFLKKHDLITIPPLARETWRMEMMSPERQRINPFFTGGEQITVSYPTDSMTHEQKMTSMRGNNIHFSRATVFHEAIPGHHLQMFMTARYRRYREAFFTPFWIEGWALYWEMLLWDMRFQQSPADRVGALFWRLHRCARIVFSLSFHLEKMTAQQAVDYLADRVGHERENAAGEVRRSVEDSGYSALYQAAYMLGALQFRALHGELVTAGKMTAKQFHDTILREGYLPVEMVRATLTNRPPARDFKTNWRFHE